MSRDDASAGAAKSVIASSEAFLGVATLRVEVPEDALSLSTVSRQTVRASGELYFGRIARGYSYPYVCSERGLRDRKVVEEIRELFLHVGESKAVTIDFPAPGNLTAVPSPG